jgi:uncharacterized membrane protein YhaH (DUF805 family)
LFSGTFVIVEELLKTRLSDYWFLIIAWPAIAISIKRWHDRDKAGWWLLILFVPVVGIWNLIECGFLPGTPAANRFGPDPMPTPERGTAPNTCPATPAGGSRTTEEPPPLS